MIEARAVSKRFGSIEALRNVSLKARYGEVIGLIGPNGSGKSTLIKTLLGLTKPSFGEVWFGGVQVTGTWEYRRMIGYMPQAAHFPGNLTGDEVVAMLKELRQAQGPLDEELFERFALERELKKPVKTLSGGTRQKLNAALAFLFQPQLLVLDEPTASLDPLSSDILKQKIVRERERGRSFLITSHIMAEVEALADRVVYLSEGTLLFDEPLDDLLGRTGQGTLEKAILQFVRVH